MFSFPKTAFAAVVALGTSFAGVMEAKAATILSFSQAVGGNPVVGTRTGNSTTISGTDILVTITQFDGAPVIFQAYLDFSVTNTGIATVPNPGEVRQNYAGGFSFNSQADGLGINYLSSTFIDFVAGGGSSLVLSASTPPSANVSFLSDVIPPNHLLDPRAISFGFSNVTPQAAIVNDTIRSFRASIAGTVSAEAVAVPEPASLALFGAGLLGLGFIRRARRKA